MRARKTPLVQQMRDVNERLLVAGLQQQELAEEAEREHREKVALLESTAEGIFGVNPEGRCTFINKAAARMLGYTPEEVLGQDVDALIHCGRKGEHDRVGVCPLA